MRSQHWERETDTHIFFWGGIFSQWYSCSFIDPKDVEYTSTEQYMMAKKCLAHGDYKGVTDVMECDDPREQKAIGRRISNYSDEIWNPKRYQVVVDGNFYKFTQDPRLKELLISTGNKIIVEASPYDKVWGIGLGTNDNRVLNESLWDGQNLLGKAIMDVRELLKKG
jgi:ribA/ribD-fused uncharacterized protein